MANTPSTPAPAEAPKAVEGAVLLDEFCRELSATSRRVELIAGFHAAMTKDKRTKDSRTAFSRAFTTYCKRPIR